MKTKMKEKRTMYNIVCFQVFSSYYSNLKMAQIFPKPFTCNFEEVDGVFKRGVMAKSGFVMCEQSLPGGLPNYH